jgi:pantoate--beta-alanine ligase
MSSRNKYLEGSLRNQAAALPQAIAKARQTVKENGAVPAATLRRNLQAFIEKQPAARIDYIEFFNPATLASVEVVDRRTHMALAVFIGSTRLIDNAALGGKDL